MQDDSKPPQQTEAGPIGPGYGIVRQEKISRDGDVIGYWIAGGKRQGRQIQRPFFDQVLGGREAALALAIAWHDAVMRLIPPVTKRQAQTRLRRNNVSGFSGVFPKRVQGQIVSWRATLETPQRRYSKNFSVKTYGDDRAKELAIAERQRLLEQHGTDDTFITVNQQATQEATQRFGHLLGQPNPVTDDVHRVAHLQALNQWFDQLHPGQLYVRLKTSAETPDGLSEAAYMRILSTGAQRHVTTKNVSLRARPYRQRLPEFWQFVETTIIAWHGRQRWQSFAARHEAAFMASNKESGFHARDYSAPAAYPECLTPPAMLQPMLADFELPTLPWMPVLVKPIEESAAITPTETAITKNLQSPSDHPKSLAATTPAALPSRAGAAWTPPEQKKESFMDRTFKAHSPLGDQLRFRSLSGSEKISDLFVFWVNLLSESDSISAKSLLGQDMTIEIDLTTKKNGAGKRFLSGQVTEFQFSGRDGDFYSYTATLRPWLWLATRRTDFKIFQFKSVPKIVEEVLAPYGFSIINKLTGAYREWEYCVQYDESDFNFISRLLEGEGAYYYFQHQQGSHGLVLADDIGSHGPLPAGPSTHPYYPATRAALVNDEDYVDEWSAYEDIASGRFAADDYDFKKPRAMLDTRQAQPAGHNQDGREIFDWPGGYTQVGDGDNYARVRIEQIKAQREVMRGAGNARNLAPGYLFSLSQYPRADQNQRYLIEAANYQFDENVYRSDGGGADSPTRYRLGIQAVPFKVPYRSQRHTPKPRTKGPQTAVIVGPPGEEIWTDQYGRVKVQFHWDRYGKMDQNSSCWIRVSSAWAGANYGGIFIPRIGQEVIVDFLSGDPDYPIITGRVYNAMMMPPWDLPANKTQSGVKTRSSKNGTPGDGMKNSAGTANAIRFEDMAGKEQLWLHAQKDQLTEVENDEDKWVGNDRRKVIDRDEFNTIHRDRTEVVDRNEKINVHGWRTEEVDLDETITIHGNRTEVVDKDEDITIHQNRSDTVDLNETRTVHQNRTRTVDHNEKVTVGQNRVKTVGLTETDTIGILHTETVGVANLDTVGLTRMSNIGILYDLNVGLMMKTFVGLSQDAKIGQTKDTKVGQKYTLTVGDNANLTMEPDSITLQVGAAIIVMKTDGTITINGKEIDVVGSKHIGMESERIDVN